MTGFASVVEIESVEEDPFDPRRKQRAVRRFNRYRFLITRPPTTYRFLTATRRTSHATLREEGGEFSSIAFEFKCEREEFRELASFSVSTFQQKSWRRPAWQSCVPDWVRLPTVTPCPCAAIDRRDPAHWLRFHHPPAIPLQTKSPKINQSIPFARRGPRPWVHLATFALPAPARPATAATRPIVFVFTIRRKSPFKQNPQKSTNQSRSPGPPRDWLRFCSSSFVAPKIPGASALSVRHNGQVVGKPGTAAGRWMIPSSTGPRNSGAKASTTTDYDMYATMHLSRLHLPGIDRRRLTYRHNGIDRRTTGVYGEVLREVMA